MLKPSNWKTFVFRLKEKARKRLVNLRDFHTRASENLLSAETYKFLNKRILLKKSAVHRNFSKSNIKPGKNKICIPILIRCKWCDRIYISWGGLPWTTKNIYIHILKSTFAQDLSTLQNLTITKVSQFTQSKDTSDKPKMLWSMNQIERNYV